MRGRTLRSGGFAAALVCLSLFASGCSKSETADKALDTSRLPRVASAKEVFASPATTIFTSPDSVAQTADALEKKLIAVGWQRFVAPNTAYADNPQMRTMSLKMGAQALNVFITVAPAQNNATSVQYSWLVLKTDLPFTKDASNIEYSSERPLLTLVTAQPADKTLDFYRKELGERNWSLWSEQTNGKQPADGPSGVIHERGAYAHYITDKDPSIAMVLTLQKADAGKLKVELKQYPVGVLASLHKVRLNSDTADAPLVDVRALPRLDGAEEDTARTSIDRVTYSVPGSVANTIAATRRLLAAGGWMQYVAPLEETHQSLLAFKKGPQGLSVSFSMKGGKADQSIVYYSPTRLQFALAFPDDAADIVFDQNRPYLSLVTAGTIDATRDFYNQKLLASGWAPLSAKDAAAKWPNATLDAPPANGARAYYIRGTERPIVLALQPSDDKTGVEIKVPTFALAQTLETGEDIFGLPRPTLAKSAGGTGGAEVHEMHALVPAEVATVLAFYRRELTARNWKEETQGAVLMPDEVVLNFTPPEGTAVLKLGHKYDLTTVSLVQRLPKPIARPSNNTSNNTSIDAMMKEAQEMIRKAEVLSPPKAPPVNEPAETLRPLAGSNLPVPLPETAADIEVADGRLEFNSASSVKSVAEFYRLIMKQQGWQAQPSVINNANMVVLKFSKARQSVSFTVLRMGAKTNVTADGSAIKDVAQKPAVQPGNAQPADTPSQASADDLEAEESGGLPVPKRHTMTEGTKTPFRRELNANVPLDLNTVLGFYRRELGKLDWKEQGKDTAVTQDSAVLTFASSEGPARLKLGRKDGETTVNLSVRNPDAAAKAGVIPKVGQAKLLISNPNESEVMITINKQSIKAAAGVGMKGPDGPVLELAPGKYKFSIKMPGKPTSNDELNVGADETWGLLIGPGGALPMRVY